MNGTWLDSALKHKNISQAELARLLSLRLGREIDRSMIYKAVHDKRRLQIDELDAIVEITGFPKDPAVEAEVKKRLLTETTREAELLNDFRNLGEDERRAIEQMLRALVSKSKKP